VVSEVGTAGTFQLDRAIASSNDAIDKHENAATKAALAEAKVAN
jgi:hypothetical protein